MKKVFTIKGIDFYEEEFQDNIKEFQDLIPLIQDFQEDLDLQKIECAEENDCCGSIKFNYISEIIGVITEEDEFYSLDEVRSKPDVFKSKKLEPFGIQIYKCLGCNKWIINILE